MHQRRTFKLMSMNYMVHFETDKVLDTDMHGAILMTSQNLMPCV